MKINYIFKGFLNIKSVYDETQEDQFSYDFFKVVPKFNKNVTCDDPIIYDLSSDILERTKNIIEHKPYYIYSYSYEDGPFELLKNEIREFHDIFTNIDSYKINEIDVWFRIVCSESTYKHIMQYYVNNVCSPKKSWNKLEQKINASSNIKYTIKIESFVFNPQHQNDVIFSHKIIDENLLADFTSQINKQFCPSPCIIEKADIFRGQNFNFSRGLSKKISINVNIYINFLHFINESIEKTKKLTDFKTNYKVKLDYAMVASLTYELLKCSEDKRDESKNNNIFHIVTGIAKLFNELIQANRIRDIFHGADTEQPWDWFMFKLLKTYRTHNNTPYYENEILKTLINQAMCWTRNNTFHTGNIDCDELFDDTNNYLMGYLIQNKSPLETKKVKIINHLISLKEFVTCIFAYSWKILYGFDFTIGSWENQEIIIKNKLKEK